MRPSTSFVFITFSTGLKTSLYNEDETRLCIFPLGVSETVEYVSSASYTWIGLNCIVLQKKSDRTSGE